jgi:PKD repeat protein
VNLTQSKGDLLYVDSKTNGGFTFQAHTNDPITFAKINQSNWDFVVLQGQSQEPSFPTQQVNTSTLPYAIQLADSVYDNNACSQVMYFMTWGRQNGDPQWDSINTFDKMNKRLRDAYLRIADSSNASIAAVGSAWKFVRDNHPSINLYSGDGSHPSLAGTYLSACVFYSSLFRKSTVGATYVAGLDANTASILQEVASFSVMDSLNLWNLVSPDSLTTATYTFNVTDNSVAFVPDFNLVNTWSWDFGDGNFSQDQQPVHVYNTPGIYTVSLTASGPCGTTTHEESITISASELDEFEVYPLFAQLDENSFRLISKSGPVNMKIYNALGALEFEGIQNNADILSFSESGMYFLFYSSDNNSRVKKIVIN